MKEARCPEEGCTYRSSSDDVNEVIEDVRQHIWVKHGKVNVQISDIPVKEFDIHPMSGCVEQK